MKSLKMLIFTCCAAGFLAHCSGNSLIDTSNPSGSAEIGVLQVSVTQHLNDGTAPEADLDGSKTLTNDLGFTVKVEEAMVNWHALKLVSGGDDAECQPGLDQELSIQSSQDYLGEDLIEHLLVEHEIPRVAYCHYELTLAPGVAPAAIKNHEGEEHGNSTFPESFHLAGTWSKDAASGSFHLDTTDPVTIAGAFHALHDGEVIEHPLHFHEGETAKALVIGTNYDLLLNGIDFQNQTEDQQRDQVVANFSAAVDPRPGASD